MVVVVVVVVVVVAVLVVVVVVLIAVRGAYSRGSWCSTTITTTINTT